MHTPGAVAPRPLPKRTRSTAGLEELDAWLTQFPNTSTSSSTTPLCVQSRSTGSQETPVASGVPFRSASRKRHHSLPSASTSLAPCVEPVHDSRARSQQSKPTRRPELSLPTDTLRSSVVARSHSNQYSPSLHGSQTEASYSPLPSGYRTYPEPGYGAEQQPPEMSPREDYLVRAFISDAMKFEHADDGHDLPARELCFSRPQLDVHAVASETATTTTPSAATSNQSHHKWTRDEDDKLRDAVSRFGGKSWKLIAETLGNGRTDVQCLHRWNKVLKPGLVKGPWTPEEDRILLNLISRYGVGQIRWCDVALHLPGRIGKQCRERWCNHLDSSIRKGQWTPQEDDTVFRMQQTIGNKWSEIAKKLPGRTENAVKNRFNSAARRKWLMSQAAASSTTTSSSMGGKITRQHPLQQEQHTTMASLGSKTPRGSSSGGLARTSELLPSDLLAGPPRPPASQQQPPSPLFRGMIAAAPSPLIPLDDGASFRGSEPPRQHPPFYSLTDDFSSSPPPQAPPQAGYINPGAVDGRPTFAFHPGNAFHTMTPQPPPTHFRPAEYHPPPSSHSLAALTAFLAPGKKEEEPAKSFSRESRGDPVSTFKIEEDNQDELVGTASFAEDDVTSRRASRAFAGSQFAHGDDFSLRSINIPDGETEGSGGGQGSSPVDMDDQNMSTFLDSVALELDDMI